MGSARWGYGKWGYTRWGVVNDHWTAMKKRLEALGGTSISVTHRRLRLGDENTTYLWYEKSYDDSTVDMIIIPKGSRELALQAGSYVRTDALGLTQTGMFPQDEVKAGSDYYEFKAAREVNWLNSFSHREVDLSLLSLHPDREW